MTTILALVFVIAIAAALRSNKQHQHSFDHERQLERKRERADREFWQFSARMDAICSGNTELYEHLRKCHRRN